MVVIAIAVVVVCAKIVLLYSVVVFEVGVGRVRLWLRLVKVLVKMLSAVEVVVVFKKVII